MALGNPKDYTAKVGNIFLTLAQAVLGLRLVFSLLNADVNNTFVRWVYAMSEPLLAPIRGIIPPQTYDNSVILEFRVLFAMVAWSVVGYVVMSYIEKIPKPKGVKLNLKDIIKF